MARGHKNPYMVTSALLVRLHNRGFKVCRRCKEPIEVGSEVQRTLFHIYHKRCLKWL